MDIIFFHWILSLTIINTLVFCLSASFSFFAEPHPKSFWPLFFYITSYISQMFIFSVIISGISISIAIILQNPLWFIPITSLISMITLFFLAANSITYAKYRFNINKSIFYLVFGKGSREVVQPSRTETLVALIGLLLAFLLSLGIQTAAWSLNFSQNELLILYVTNSVLAGIYLFNQLYYFICSHCGHMPILQYTVKLYGYDAFSIYRFLQRSGIAVTNPHNQLIHNLKNSLNQSKSMQYPLNSIQKQGANHKPMNVLMIMIDSWRFDMLCPLVTPNIYRFSQKAQIFSNHWSSGNTTQPGVFGAFYGIPANYWNMIKRQQIPPVLISELQKAHYQIKILASANLINPPFHQTVFSSIENLNTFTPGETPLERDQYISESMVNFLTQKNQDQPFFGFMFFDSAHGYYAIPDLPIHFKPVKQANHISMSRTIDPTPIFNLYKNALYCIDQYIQQILLALEQTKLIDNTVVILTGDHGQEFNDLKKNYWEHPSNFGRYQVKVPLIIKQPHTNGQQFTHLTTHYDLSPTILQDVLNVINSPADYCIGANLYQTTGRPDFIIVSNYTNFGIIDHNHIINLQHNGHYHITDFALNPIERMKPNVTTINQAIDFFNRYSVANI